MISRPGHSAGGSGLITVTGKSDAGPSFLSASQNIVLGVEGSGVMVIEEDATVTCGSAALGVFAGAIGRVELGVNNAAGTPARWVVNSDLTLGGIGTGTVVLRNSANVTVGQTLSILNNGSIGGTGTYSAQTVQNGGTGAPGNSAGLMKLEANYVQTPEGTLAMEIGGVNAGQSDVLHVTGNTTLDGTMEVRFINNFLPGGGPDIRIAQAGWTGHGQLCGDHVSESQTWLPVRNCDDRRHVPTDRAE